jgi:hypothetical protein
MTNELVRKKAIGSIAKRVGNPHAPHVTANLVSRRFTSIEPTSVKEKTCAVSTMKLCGRALAWSQWSSSCIKLTRSVFPFDDCVSLYLFSCTWRRDKTRKQDGVIFRLLILSKAGNKK